MECYTRQAFHSKSQVMVRHREQLCFVYGWNFMQQPKGVRIFWIKFMNRYPKKKKKDK